MMFTSWGSTVMTMPLMVTMIRCTATFSPIEELDQLCPGSGRLVSSRAAARVFAAPAACFTSLSWRLRSLPFGRSVSIDGHSVPAGRHPDITAPQSFMFIAIGIITTIIMYAFSSCKPKALQQLFA